MQTNANNQSKESGSVLVVRDCAAWLADKPWMRSESYSDTYAVEKWVREWGEQALGLQVRDL